MTVIPIVIAVRNKSTKCYVLITYYTLLILIINGATELCWHWPLLQFPDPIHSLKDSLDSGPVNCKHLTFTHSYLKARAS